MNNDGKPFSFAHFASNVYNLLHIFNYIYLLSLILEPKIICALTVIFSYPCLNFHSLIQLGCLMVIISPFLITEMSKFMNLLYCRMYYLFPHFQYNLVSVAKLTSQLQTFVLFTDEHCLVQDPSSKSSIALGILGKRINDLYVFYFHHLTQNLSYCLSVSSMFPKPLSHVFRSYSNNMLWHNRFRHVPLLKLKSLLSLPSHTDDVSIEHYLICAQAKQS